MTSNFFSRLAPASQQRSFYEELRSRNDDLDVEDRAGFALDDENLNHSFQQDDLDPETLAIEHSRMTLASDPRPGRHHNTMAAPQEHATTWPHADEEGDNDVPASLLVEDNAAHPTSRSRRHARTTTTTLPRPHDGPEPSTRRLRAQWEVTQHQQRLHQDDYPVCALPHTAARSNRLVGNVVTGTPEQKAMWRWVNVTNLDSFMQDVYDYYRGNGLWCILLDRVLHLVEVGFIVAFLTFLTQCIDYSRFPHSKSMNQVLIPQCTKKMSSFWNFGLWIFVFYFIWKAIQIPLDIRRLLHLQDYYTHLLGIPGHDMQTVSWQDVVVRIMALRDQNPKTAGHLTARQRRWLGSQSKERLDAHDIANRLMRRENFLIALINKDILDLTIPLPFLSGRQYLSRLLEWTLNFSVMDYVFDERGQVNQEFLKSDRRGQLSQKLRARFLFAGVMTLMIAPIMAGYLFVMHFLTYFHEYRKNPSALGTRSYTPLAEWKFREFNELPHIFQERLNMSYPFATRYLDQFPKEMTARMARTVSFIAGALATVLAIVTMVDTDLGFEITPDRTVLFYLPIFAGAWAFARGMVPEENTVFEPEYALRQVIEYIHYEPDRWHGLGLHSSAVKDEFAALYKNKLVIFLEEIVGILIAPLILSVSLPRSSDQIVDFFREFTIHVDGLGYICSFAEFDFKKGLGRPKADADTREDYYATKHGKMAASYYGFIDNYVINPRTGIPGHLPPGARNQFQPPPAFPSLQSSTLAADMAASRMGRSELGRARSRGPGGPSHVGRMSRHGMTAPPTLSPMASILLDPHHQPPASTLGRSMHRPRQGRHREDMIEEGLEGEETEGGMRRRDEDDAYESGHGLDESAWQASPAQGLGRDNSARNEGDREDGVFGMMYQFQRELQHMPGGLR